MYRLVRVESEESGDFNQTRPRFTVKLPSDFDWVDASMMKLVGTAYVTTNDGQATEGIYPVNLKPLEHMVRNFTLESEAYQTQIDARVYNGQLCANTDYFTTDNEQLRYQRVTKGGSLDEELDRNTYHATCPTGSLYQHPLRHFVRPIAPGVEVNESAVGNSGLAIGGLRENVEFEIETSAEMSKFSTIFSNAATNGNASQFPLSKMGGLKCSFELDKDLDDFANLMIPTTDATLATINAITAANPAEFTTVAAHGLGIGQPITISGVTGTMGAAVNISCKVATVPSPTEFTIVTYAGVVVDTTGLAYTAGGIVQGTRKAKLLYPLANRVAVNPTYLYSTLLFADQRLYKEQPFYIGQWVNIWYQDGATATTYTMVQRRITAIEINDGLVANAVKYTFNALLTAATSATVCTMSPATFNTSLAADTPIAIDWGFSHFYIQIPVVNLMKGQLEAANATLGRGFDYPFYQHRLEMDNIPATAYYWKQLAIAPNTIKVTPFAVDPTSDIEADRNAVTSYRWSHNGILTTNRDINVGAPRAQQPLQYDRLLKAFAATGEQVTSLAKRFSALSYTSTAAREPKDILLMPQIMNFTNQPQVAELMVYAANGNMTAKTMMYYHTQVRTLSFDDGKLMLA
jgi:hypothetical protein